MVSSRSPVGWCIFYKWRELSGIEFWWQNNWEDLVTFWEVATNFLGGWRSTFERKRSDLSRQKVTLQRFARPPAIIRISTDSAISQPNITGPGFPSSFSQNEVHVKILKIFKIFKNSQNYNNSHSIVDSPHKWPYYNRPWFSQHKVHVKIFKIYNNSLITVWYLCCICSTSFCNLPIVT
jgi:hypothetical protein